MYAHLRYLGPSSTEVDYRLDLDPGGSVPKWVVRWLVKRLPLKTIRRLRRQISKTRGGYDAFLNRHDHTR